MDNKNVKGKNKTKKLEEEPIKKEMREPSKKEKIQSVIIVILSLVIVFGLAYFVPELQNCGSCQEKEVELTKITMDDYRTLLAGDEVSLIYLASPTCGYCAQQEPIMKQLMSKYDVNVNYLNTSKINNDEADEVYKVYGKVQEERYEVDGVRTPTILLVQKGKLVDMNLGNIDLDDLVDLLQKYITVEE